MSRILSESWKSEKERKNWKIDLIVDKHVGNDEYLKDWE
jgi:hypothetical protein